MSSAEQPTSVADKSTIHPSSHDYQEEGAVTALDLSQHGPVIRPEKTPSSPRAGESQTGIATPFASNPSQKANTAPKVDLASPQLVSDPHVQLIAEPQERQFSSVIPQYASSPPDTSALELAFQEHHGSTATSTAAVWQQELNAVRQHQGQPAAPDPITTYPVPQPTVLLQHAASNDAALSSSRAAASDSRSDNESLHAHASLPGLQPAPQAAGLDPQLSGATDSAGEGSADESSERQGEFRGAKKPRLVWTTELHARFMNAVNHLGVKNAVPKTILQLMNVDGMTRENVASHLQKYRLYLKKLGGYTSSAKTTPEDLQAIQRQALQQQEREAYQQQIGAAQGIHTHVTPQGYFGPTSLMYGPPGASAMLDTMQPYGPSAGPQPWYGPAPAAGPASSSMGQMASAYGLLQSHSMQAQQQQPPFGQPQQWSWGPSLQAGGWPMGSNSTYMDASGFGDPTHPAYNMPQSSSGSLPAAGPSLGPLTQGSSNPEGAVPDALAHLLSAAEAASSKRK